MRSLVFDCETTGAQRNKGNPFDPRNKLMCIGFGGEDGTICKAVEHQPEPYKETLINFQGFVNACDTIVAFNAKFDMHWCKRYGISFEGKKVWDCQLFHFIQSNQRHRMPSLNEVAEHYGFPPKLDVVKTEYWAQNIDTDAVPWDILKEYAEYDVELTYQIYLKQMAEFELLPQNRQNLILLHMEDLLGLEEMEYNGTKYNVALSLSMAEQLEREITAIDSGLSRYCPNVSISFNSDRQLSAFLYGGVVVKDEQETYTFHYKDGREAQKQRWIKKEYKLPKIIDPLKGTDNANGWSVDVGTLRTLLGKAKGFQRRILEPLVARSKLEKRMSTYCLGTPKLLEHMQWQHNLLHPSINQCVAITGRLSETKPNLQNQDGAMRICFPSRYTSKKKI